LDFSEYGYEVLGFIEGWKFLEFLKDCQLFTMVLVGLLLSSSAFHHGGRRFIVIIISFSPWC
jgi:hypothetical protein